MVHVASAMITLAHESSIVSVTTKRSVWASLSLREAGLWSVWIHVCCIEAPFHFPRDPCSVECGTTGVGSARDRHARCGRKMHEFLQYGPSHWIASHRLDQDSDAWSRWQECTSSTCPGSDGDRTY